MVQKLTWILDNKVMNCFFTFLTKTENEKIKN